MYEILKRNTLVEKVEMERDTSIFIQNFEELVKTIDSIMINSIIKFLTNPLQAELVINCKYNNSFL